MKNVKLACLLTALTVTVSVQAQQIAAVTMYTLDGKSIDVPAVPEGKYWKVPAPAAEGFYSISRSKPVYLAPGFKLQMLPKDKGYIFKGKGSRHNKLFDSLQQIANKKFDLQYGRVKDYWWNKGPEALYEKLEQFRKEGMALIKSLKGSTYFNKVANAELRGIERIIVSSYSHTYGRNPETTKRAQEMHDRNAPEDSVVLMFEKAQEKKLNASDKMRIDSLIMGNIDINDEALFIASYAFRREYDNQMMRLAWQLPGNKSSRGAMNEAKFKVVQENVASHFIREYYGYAYVTGILKDAEARASLDSAYQLFMSLAKNERYRSVVKEIYEKRIKYVKGAPSPQFVFADTSGTLVSLESLKGKYVYIDLWATWCGPCKAEIPHLKKIEKKYHNKNISFVSISIDELGDKQKWINFVKKEQLTGIQLMADKAWETAFVKDYTIVGIPHFILLGPAGEIIDPKAKRPSDPELDVQLNSLLQ